MLKTINQDNYVDEAEKVIKTLKGRKNQRNGREIQMVTTSKIRSLLAMTSDIYNETLNETESKLPQRLCSRIEYLRVRFIYESGKDQEGKVEDFVETARILDILKEIRGEKENFLLFARYMEALVAFHKFYGGKD